MAREPLFRGSGVALVTPFDDGGVNVRALRDLVRFQLEEGTDALVVNGSTGEAATMSAAEQRAAVEAVVAESGGQVPVIVGCGGSDTAAVSELAAAAAAAGADALLLSAPPYNKPPQRGIEAHFRAAMDAAGDLPAVLYNVPGRTAVGIAPETVARLAEDERVIGIKEACGDLSQIATLAALVEDRITLWSGNDDQILPILSLGGLGVISVLANVSPADTSRMVHTYLDGDTTTATSLQLRYLPLIRELFAVSNPIPVKTLVGWLGFDVGPVRLPLVPLTDGERDRLVRAAEDVGLRPRR